MTAIETIRIAARTVTYQSVSRARTDSKIVIVETFGQRVAGAAASVEQLDGVAVVDLAPQPLDVDLDQVRIRIERVVPDVLGDVASARDLALASRKILEQRE